MPINAYLVLGVVPANNEQQVPTSTTITVSFAKHMDVTTLHAGNIILRKVNGDIVPITFNYVNESYKLLVHHNGLDPNTQYQLEIKGGTTGVKSVTGDYMNVARTYEFTTVQLKAVSEPRNLVLTQKESFVQATWSLPVDTNENEAIVYDVRISASNDPEAPVLWPQGSEGTTSLLTMTIPYEVTRGSRYYVFVRARGGAYTSTWTVGQIFMELPEVTEPTNPTNPTDPDPTPTPDPFQQLEIVDMYPANGSVIEENKVLLVFSDELDTLPDNALYVVKAPHKETLSMVDLLTTYSPAKAVPGTVSLLDGHAQVLQWEPIGELVEESSYVAIVSKDIKGKTVAKMGTTKSIGFSTPWERMYGKLTSVKEMIGGYANVLSESYIYEIMNRNSVYAYDIVIASGAATDTDFADGKIPYFVLQYVNTQTAYDLILNGLAGGGSSSSSTTDYDGGFVLGLLEVTGGGSGTSTSTASDGINVLAKLKDELKQWKDLLYDQHSRGYAKPTGAVKGETGSAYPDFLTRAELTSLFD